MLRGGECADRHRGKRDGCPSPVLLCTLHQFINRRPCSAAICSFVGNFGSLHWMKFPLERGSLTVEVSFALENPCLNKANFLNNNLYLFMIIYMQQKPFGILFQAYHFTVSAIVIDLSYIYYYRACVTNQSVI